MACMAIKKLSLNSALQILFIAQCVDGVHSSGAPCREKAGDDACENRNEQSHDDDGDGDCGGNKFLENESNRNGNSQSDQTTNQANSSRFNQELKEYSAALGADSFANAYFASSFGDGYEHDIHNSN